MKTLKIIPATLLAITLGLGTGTTLAYFTDAEHTTNEVTVGHIDVTLTEPHFSQTTVTGNPVVQFEEVAKDPIVTNVADADDAIVFLKVTAPRENVHMVGNDGSLGTAQTQELYWFKQNSDAVAAHANHFRSTWIELPKKESAGTYVFGYQTRLKPGESTDALFDKVQRMRVLEESGNSVSDIKIQVYAIQADNVYNANHAFMDTTKVLTADQLDYIYSVYVAQNG